MEFFHHVWRADNNIIRNVVTEIIHKTRPIGDHERDGNMQQKNISKCWEEMCHLTWH